MVEDWNRILLTSLHDSVLIFQGEISFWSLDVLRSWLVQAAVAVSGVMSLWSLSMRHLPVHLRGRNMSPTMSPWQLDWFPGKTAVFTTLVLSPGNMAASLSLLSPRPVCEGSKGLDWLLCLGVLCWVNWAKTRLRGHCPVPVSNLKKVSQIIF